MAAYLAWRENIFFTFKEGDWAIRGIFIWRVTLALLTIADAKDEVV